MTKNHMAASLEKTLQTIRDIFDGLDAIDQEDARRTAAREASVNFQKAVSNE